MEKIDDHSLQHSNKSPENTNTTMQNYINLLGAIDVLPAHLSECIVDKCIATKHVEYNVQKHEVTVTFKYDNIIDDMWDEVNNIANMADCLPILIMDSTVRKTNRDQHVFWKDCVNDMWLEDFLTGWPANKMILDYTDLFRDG
jgi:hypothetical protein